MLSVIRDEYPEINVTPQKDSIDQQKKYFLGTISDDYGLTKLQLVYYPSAEEGNKKIVNIPINISNFDQFVYAFPENLSLIRGVSYNFYFVVFDNDAIQNFKSSKSTLFTHRKQTLDEIENQQLLNQENAIKDLDRSLEKNENPRPNTKRTVKVTKRKKSA